jgi:threonine dehydrogenase-like Zn-dependent dehydrogenase
MPHRDCGLAESFLSHQAVAVPIPEGIEDPGVAALIQPLSTLLFAVEKLGDVTGREVLILGAGPIGLFAAWLLRRGGAAHVRVVDPVAARCEAGLKFGATAFLTATSGEARALQRSRLTGWPLAEIVVEAVGHQPGTLNDAIALARSGGRLLALGVPDQPVYALDYERLFRKNLHLIASVAPQWETYLARAADLLCRFQTELKPLITHRFGMGAATAAYALAEQKEEGVLKVLLEASDWPAAGGKEEAPRP